VAGGVIISFARMNRILEIDLENERAVVEPGVVNLDITLAVQAKQYFFAPDPSSQKACTIGGNVAENAGGPHTLAYGVTTNHILGLEAVLPDGTVVTTGGKELDLPGYDLTGLLTGSEGTMALITKAVVRLVRQPEAVKTILAIYDSTDGAGRTVSEITARAITPVALEMLDGVMLRMVEEATQAGYRWTRRRFCWWNSRDFERWSRSRWNRCARPARAAAPGSFVWRAPPPRGNCCGKAARTHSAPVGRVSPFYYVQDGSCQELRSRPRCASSPRYRRSTA